MLNGVIGCEGQDCGLPWWGDVLVIVGLVVIFAASWWWLSRG